MTLAEYHAHPALSRSRLWLLHDSPQKFKYAIEHPEEPTPAFRLGAAFHKLALEPETFDEEYIPYPGYDRRTKEGKQMYAEFLEEAHGRTILTYDEMETIMGMVKSLMANPTAKKLVENGQKEQSFFWTNARTNLELKCRPDIFLTGNGPDLIVDLKSTTSSETKNFTNECIRYGYDVQSSFYIEGLKTVYPDAEFTFMFIAVEKNPPYAVNVMEMDPEVVKYGQERFEALLVQYQECRASGNWYGYNGADGEINRIELPKWAIMDE